MRMMAGDSATFKGTSTGSIVQVPMVNPITGKASFARLVKIRNTGGTNPLRVYFPGNSTFETVAANTDETYEGPIVSVAVQQETAGTTYEIHANIA